MTWNSRVMLRDGRYAVHAVDYADDGRITNGSAGPMPLTGKSIEKRGEEMGRYRLALSERVVDYEAPESFVPERPRADAQSRAAANPARRCAIG